MNKVGEQQTLSGPRTLPIVEWRGKLYYFDYRLKQLRSVSNPHNFISLTDIQCEMIALLIQ